MEMRNRTDGILPRVRFGLALVAVLAQAWPALAQDVPEVTVAPPKPQDPAAVPAPGTPDANATPPLDAVAEPTIGPGEIRLDGTVDAVDATQNTMVLSVNAFTLPNGKSQVVTPVKPKTIVVATTTTIHPSGDPATHNALGDLAVGTLVSVIGRDTGTGKNLNAREIVVAATPAVGDATVPDFATQIQALRADVDALKAAAPAAIPADTVTKAQLNDLIAALRREFAIELQRISARLDKLEAARPAAPAAPPAPAAR